jgi:DNA-directed RNA polymerase subunit H (RpoH/RPB5)
MSKKLSDVEKRAALIIKYREMRVKEKMEEEDLITYTLSKGGKEYILQCVLTQGTVGVSFVRNLRDIVEKTEAEGGILLSDVKYTYSAKANAPKLEIELIPPTLPTFDLFKHALVPKAELVAEEERQELLKKFHAEPYQFPWIKTSDPVSIVLGAIPGDIIRFISDSLTAGASETYRYVI